MIGACLPAIVSPVVLHGQGPNAQDLTQSIFDQHKGADPTNSDRALTDKIQQKRDVRIQQVQVPVPAMTPQKPTVDKKTLKQIQDLREQKKDFVKTRTQEEKQKMMRTLRFAEVNDTEITEDANEAWKKTPTGRDLRKLEAKVSAEQRLRKSEAKREIRISDVPLPSR